MACGCSTAMSPTGTRVGRKAEPLRVDFYHLTATPLERALPRIVERIVADGGRAVIVAADAEQRGALDRLLWTYAVDSFLPHAQAGGDDDGDQPVLIAETPVAANGARFAVLADGLWRDEALGFERAFHFFDDEAVVAARAAWRALAAQDGVERHYWRQDEGGRWERAG